MNFQEIEYNSELYQAELSLRNAALREPLGLSLSASDIADEDQQIHFGLISNLDVIACVVIKPIDGLHVKLRQMAVDFNHQGLGIGKLLLSNTENILVQKYNFKNVILNARLSAESFYKKCGYASSGPVFKDIGLDHILMHKSLES